MSGLRPGLCQSRAALQTRKIGAVRIEKRGRFYLVSVHKLTVSPKAVIPAKAGIQFFQDLLDAPVASTPCQARGRLRQAPQVRHDGKSAFINRLYLKACIRPYTRYPLDNGLRPRRSLSPPRKSFQSLS